MFPGDLQPVPPKQVTLPQNPPPARALARTPSASRGHRGTERGRAETRGSPRHSRAPYLGEGSPFQVLQDAAESGGARPASPSALAVRRNSEVLHKHPLPLAHLAPPSASSPSQRRRGLGCTTQEGNTRSRNTLRAAELRSRRTPMEGLLGPHRPSRGSGQLNGAPCQPQGAAAGATTGHPAARRTPSSLATHCDGPPAPPATH